MKFSAKQKLIFTIIFSLVASSLSAFGFWILVSGIADAQKGMRDGDSKIVAFDADRKSARRARTILKERSEDLSRIRNVLVDRERPISFIETLETYAKTVGVATTLGVDEANKEAGTLTFRLALEGKEQNILTYLSLIELLPFETKVINLNFSRTPKNEVAVSIKEVPQTTQLILSLTVKTN